MCVCCKATLLRSNATRQLRFSLGGGKLRELGLAERPAGADRMRDAAQAAQAVLVRDAEFLREQVRDLSENCAAAQRRVETMMQELRTTG